MQTLILFLVILSVLVFVHEFGHFLAARKLGMRVYEFAIGFPPMAIGFYRDPKTKKIVWVRRKKRKMMAAGGGEETQKEEEFPATLYTLNWLPLGGFCKIKGENGEEAKEVDSFGYQKAWRRLVVLVAGVAMNFILAALLLGIGFMIGLPTDVSTGVEKYARLKEEPKTIIEHVEQKSPADEAGLQLGDQVVSLNGEKIANAQKMTDYVLSHNSSTLSVVIIRNGQEQVFHLEPRILHEGEPARLGVALADAALVQFPWYIAFFKGFGAAFFGLLNIFISFFLLLKGFVTGGGLAFEVSGPVGIASVIGQSARLGIHYLLQVTAMISLSLAAINILPIPALDGGRVLFVVLEKILGKPVPLKYEQMAHTIGFVLLLLLIIIVTGRDLAKIF